MVEAHLQPDHYPFSLFAGNYLTILSVVLIFDCKNKIFASPGKIPNCLKSLFNSFFFDE